MSNHTLPRSGEYSLDGGTEFVEGDPGVEVVTLSVKVYSKPPLCVGLTESTTL